MTIQANNLSKSHSPQQFKTYGDTLSSLRRFDEAERAYRLALDLNPDYSEVYNNLGNLLRIAGRLIESVQMFLKALELSPSSAEVHNNYGNVLVDNGRYEEAVQYFLRATILNANYEIAFNNLGNVYNIIGKLDESERAYQRALELKPDYIEVYGNLGNLLRHAKRFNDAKAVFQYALSLTPDSAELLNNYGNVLMDCELFSDGESYYRKAIILNPSYATAYYNRGNALTMLKRYSVAEKCYRQALGLKPDYIEADMNLGVVLVRLGRYYEAEEIFLRLVCLDPEFNDVYNHLGLIYMLTGRYAESEVNYSKANELNSGDLNTKCNLAFLHLIQGRLEEGFQYFEHRLSRSDVKENVNSLKSIHMSKFWQGESLIGKKILLVAEQGAGDTIMMMRYLSLLSQFQPKEVIISCEQNLVRLFERTAGVDKVIVSSINTILNENADVFCSIMSLPYVFKTNLESIPIVMPSLEINDELISRWSVFLDGFSELKVGLVWAGNKEHLHDERRSIPLKLFKPLSNISGVTLISIQKGDASIQLDGIDWSIINLMDMCGDYLDTASLVSCLDLVISVDTSVAHLAATLGKPVWLLNRFESEWRWMLGRTDSPWYPSIKIFSQETLGNWEDVINNVAENLYTWKL
jgi:tetratricopeptide (TPR) repeat protein